ncbi:radical SAM family heme chaperone HemW [Candidatus Clostridium stratigraminis]|uniref:Heme chaperone HemW n=1 Tax=Candidatus Clostridium stratigraminis TaxID=3381661 RepID=A0ABW8T551_9CLOT
MEETIALYLHIPFCKQKCFYCDFPSFACKDSLMLNYTNALCKEIGSAANYKIGSIFIGGGTPTYLSLECLMLLKEVIAKLDLAEDIEFTVEGNPDSFNSEKLSIFKAMGVNRLSIGLQAWQDNLLKNLGRAHNRQQFLNTFNTARSLGFNNINVDLMFGLPNQTMSNWKETLEKDIELKPEHISCYSLIIEEGTPFYKTMEIGKLNLPEEDAEREMYEFAIEFLKFKGYKQYEISNFSKVDYECRHNLTYWNLKDYLGCGSSAHSFISNTRYRNESDIEKYIYGVNSGTNAVIEKHVNSLEDNMEEFMFMGLRKIEGISLKEFKLRFKNDIFSVYPKVLNKFLKANLLVLEGDRLYLSAKGIELSNQVMCEFILSV